MGKQLGTAGIAFDEVAEVSFEGKVFVLTGDFASGPKADIEAKINARDGLVKDSVTAKTDYLVVGNDGNAAWVNGVAGGKKVEKALELKSKGIAISIVSESAILHADSDTAAGKVEEQVAETESEEEIVPVFSPAEYFEYDIVDDGVEITKYLGFEKTVTVPNEIAGHPVVSFGETSFVVSGNHLTECVYIPNSLVRLHARAFQNGDRNVFFLMDDNHPNLVEFEKTIYNKNITELFYSTNWSETELTIPDTVEIIHDYAFEWHGKLNKVKFSDSLKKLGKGAFLNCYSFKRVDLPVSLVEIGDEAFDSNWEDVSNSKIFVPKNVFEIGGFTGRKLQISKDNKFLSVVDNLVMDANQTSIKSIVSTFITDVCIPDTVKCVDAKLFRACEGLNTITFGENVSEISNAHFLSRINIKFSKKNKTFRNDDKVLYQILADGKERLLLCYKKGIRKYEVPEQVVEICDFAFSGCDQLKELTLNEGLVCIGKNAFDNTIRLEKITLPLSVRDLEDFNHSYEIDENHPHYISDRGVIYKKLPDNNVLLLKSTDNSLTNYEMLPNTIEMLNEAFSCCSKLMEITFSQCLMRIPEKAFDYSGITELRFPKEMIEVGASAFEGCKKLTKVELNEHLKIIGYDAFANCPKHTLFTNNSGNPYFKIIDGILYDKNLKGIIAIPKGIGASNLKIPQTVSKIGTAFEDCSKIKKVTLPTSITEIPPYAFRNCTSLSEIILPDGLKQIGKSAFISTKIEKIIVPNSVEFIGESIFSSYQNVRVIGYAGSTAEKYIIENNNVHHKFEPIGAQKEIRGVNRDYNYEKIPDGIRILEYIGKKVDELNVPEFIDGNKVIEIGEGAFRGKSINKINLTNSIRKIWPSAFSGSLLTEINIPNELTIIPDFFVYGCSNLQTINIPPSVVEIHYSAFAGTSIKELTIPDTVKKIDSDIFHYSEKIVIKGTNGSAASKYAKKKRKLIFVDINQIFNDNDIYYAQSFETEYIGKNAIRIKKIYTDNEEFEIPDKILNSDVSEVQMKWSYQGHETVRTLIIPSSVQLLEINFNIVFTNLNKIIVSDKNKRYFTNEYGLFDRIEKSLIYVFDKSINSIVVPEGITTIKEYAGSNIIKLDELVLPNSLRFIESNAFFNDGWGGWRFQAIKINAVNIPIGVEDIGLNSFPKSIPIHVHPENKNYLSDSHCLYQCLEDGMLNLMYCFDNELKEYTVRPNTKSIRKGAFSYHPNLSVIHFPEALEEIGDSAFTDCDMLQQVEFNTNLLTVGKHVFANCKNIFSYKLSERLDYISFGMFENCEKLKQITIPSSIKKIDDYAFAGIKLDEVKIPQSVNHVGISSFSETKHIVVYDTMFPTSKPAEDLFVDTTNGKPNAPIGMSGIFQYKNYTLGACNSRWHDHKITVLDSISEAVLFQVWMGGQDENRSYYCMLASAWGKGNSFKFSLADSMFDEMKVIENKIGTAFTRLIYPYVLTEEVREKFINYLKRTAKRVVQKLIDDKDIEKLYLLNELGCITKTNIDGLIEIAQEKQSFDFTSVLLELKENQFGSTGGKSFKL